MTRDELIQAITQTWPDSVPLPDFDAMSTSELDVMLRELAHNGDRPF